MWFWIFNFYFEKIYIPLRRLKVRILNWPIPWPIPRNRLELHLCLVLLQVPKCFVPVQIFCVVPKIYLCIVPVTNIMCQNKRWFAFSKIGFCAGTKVFEEALNAVKFLGCLKKFGPAQNILGPVKGQGIYQLSSNGKKIAST